MPKRLQKSSPKAKLHERSVKVDGLYMFQLQRAIVTFCLDNLSISAYYTKLKIHWDKFNAQVSFMFMWGSKGQVNEKLI